MPEIDSFDVNRFDKYSQSHKALSWWGMTILAAVPLLLFLARQPVAALVAVMVFIAFVSIDPVCRNLLAHVPVTRDRILSSVVLYIVVAGIFTFSISLSVVVLLVGIACIGLVFSRRSKIIEKQLLSTDR